MAAREDKEEGRAPGANSLSGVEVRERVVGLEEVVRGLQQLLVLPLRVPALFQRLRARPPCGVLLTGPPGVGKTSVVRVVAQECEATVVPLDCGSIMDAALGESERKLRSAFAEALNSPRPTILFMDELVLFSLNSLFV